MFFWQIFALFLAGPKICSSFVQLPVCVLFSVGIRRANQLTTGQTSVVADIETQRCLLCVLVC